MPKRIQRKRTKGWRMPKKAVYVGRPTKWGNPFPPSSQHPWNGRLIVDAADSVRTFRQWTKEWQRGRELAAAASRELRGKDLACWCKLDCCCHADILLEIANA